MTDNSRMCCFTHGAIAYGPPAADARMRCRCGVEGNGRCDRQADAEDLLCAVCREEPEPFINLSEFADYRVTGLSTDGTVTWTRNVPVEPPFPGGSGETPDTARPGR